MIIDGKKLSEKILSEVKQEVIEIKKSGKTPVLSVILIGEYPPSQIYVKNKEKMAKQVGINSEVIHYEQNVKQSEVIEKIRELNNDPKVSGIWFNYLFQNILIKRKSLTQFCLRKM